VAQNDLADRRLLDAEPVSKSLLPVTARSQSADLAHVVIGELCAMVTRALLPMLSAPLAIGAVSYVLGIIATV
jgi:hypothetical protein